MGGITQALAAAARQHGAEIRCNAPVAQIATRAGRVRGVVLADGTEILARRVASNADAHVTFLKLMDVKELPAEFVAAVRRIDYTSPSLKINVALSELPDFVALPGSQPGPQHRGTIHISPSLDYMERAYDDAKYGRPSQSPILECTIPSTVDDTVAPPGRHLMSMFVQYAPTTLQARAWAGAGGAPEQAPSWDQVKEPFADLCFDLLAEYAPNIRRAVIDRQVLSPLDIERRFGLTGGNIFQGAMTLGQLFFLRPVPGYAGYRTPIPGLYLCGAATHPGGGVMGACGYNAARVILRDRLA
jgi:phytoene dehydrogenase-like protein